MALTNVWLAGYGGPAVGATAVWIAPNDGTVPSATQVTLVGWNGPVSGATPIWIAGYGGPPPAAIGAIPICIKGWSGSGGSGGGGGTTSVWSAADAAAGGMTLSNGGLTVTPSGSGSYGTLRSSISKSSGKLYVELSTSAAVNSGTANFLMGLATSGISLTTYVGNSNYSFGIFSEVNLNFISMGTGSSSHYTVSATPAANDVWAFAADLTAGSVWISQNNVWLGGGNPATGANPIITYNPAVVGPLFAGVSFQGPNAGVWTLQSQPSQQKYLPPPGFQAWDGGPVTPSTSVWSAADATANGMTLSNGGLTVALVANKSIRGSISQNTGKVYVELLATATNTSDFETFGLASAGFNASSPIGSANYSGGISYNSNHISTGFTSNYVTTGYANTNDVVGMAIDFTAGSVWIAFNNAWVNSSNPATGTLPVLSFIPATVGALFPAATTGGASGEVWTLQPTAASQKYAPPSRVHAMGMSA